MSLLSSAYYQSKCFEKYEPLPGQFLYKNVLYSSWTKSDIIQRIENDDIFKATDTIIATFPKSGTTVLEEIVWLISNHADLEKAKALNITFRCPFIELNHEYYFPNFGKSGQTIDIINQVEEPRILKTHLLYRNLEQQLLRYPGMKVILCFRNPKDTAVSFYHFYKGTDGYGPFKGTWDEYFERWYDGWISGGDWLDVVTEWWSQRHRKNIKIIFYEDIIRKREEVIRELCVFLDKELSDEDVAKIAEHTSFDRMSENKATNYTSKCGFVDGFKFMRKGQIGDWKNYFSDEQIKRLDIKFGQVLSDCGLEFIYD